MGKARDLRSFAGARRICRRLESTIQPYTLATQGWKPHTSHRSLTVVGNELGPTFVVAGLG